MYELLLETVGNDVQATEVSFHYTPAPFWFHRMLYNQVVQHSLDSTTTYFILEMTNTQIVLRDGRSMEQLHPLPLEIAVTRSRVPESERTSQI